MKSGIQIASGFKLISKDWNFTRDGFDTIEDMMNFPTYGIPDGFMTYVKSEDSRYEFNSENTDIDGIGKWRKIDFKQMESEIESTKSEVDKILGILNEKYPFKLTYFTADKTLAEEGTTQSVRLSWGYDMGKPNSQQILKNNIPTSLPNSDVFTYTYTDITKDTNFNLKYNGNLSPTVTLSFVLPKYFGILDDKPTSETIVTLPKTTLSKSKNYTSSDLNVNFKYVCYSYPVSMGVLNSITDITGKDESINVFDKITVKINNVDYYVYYANIFVEKYKYIFS